MGHRMSEYMEFRNQAQFDAWHNNVRRDLGLDGEGLIGVNALTGLPAPNKQRTTAWCTPTEQLDDGYFIATVAGLSQAHAPAAQRKDQTYFDQRAYISLDAEGNRVKPSENPNQTEPVLPPAAG